MNKKIIADFTLLLVVFIWGSTFVIVQDAISFLTPFSFNAIRFFIAFIILLIIYFIFTKKDKLHFTKDSIKSGFVIGTWLCLGYGFQTFGLLYTTPAKAGFITGLSVVLVPLFSFLLLKYALNRNIILGVIFAAAGLYMMTMMQSSSFGIGDFLVLLCAVSFAMHIIMTSKYAAKHHAMPLTILQIGVVSLLSFIGSLLFEEPSKMYRLDVLLQPEVVIGLLVTAILATAFAFLAQTYFQAYTSPTRVALIFALEPVFAALTSYFVINEAFTASMIAGCALILVGIILAEWPVKKATKLQNQHHSH
ncbi:MAG: DMT family transporter [Bacillus sp. (in: firmicutes)]